MKITVTEDREFPTLGIIAKAGDTVEIPDDDTPTDHSPAEPDDEPTARTRKTKE